MFKRFFSILTTNLQSFKTKYVNKHAFLHNNASIIYLLSLLGIAQGRRRDVLKILRSKSKPRKPLFYIQADSMHKLKSPQYGNNHVNIKLSCTNWWLNTDHRNIAFSIPQNLFANSINSSSLHTSCSSVRLPARFAALLSSFQAFESQDYLQWNETANQTESFWENSNH